ncbi:YopX family protein [Lactiplantibacillus plantarum]|uniref:YopX family protein n=1 Tax=Lactiplantibacillus plantarum TaxID=1590 RepID=UPI003F536B14
MIKFRAWSKDLSKYRKLDDISNDQGLGMFFEVQNGIGSNVTSICYSVGDVVEQFTGLKDVNGKEIYIGDIVKYRNLDEKYQYLKIRWLQQDCMIDAGGYRIDIVARRCEVIGNVRENPELLEE